MARPPSAARRLLPSHVLLPLSFFHLLLQCAVVGGLVLQITSPRPHQIVRQSAIQVTIAWSSFRSDDAATPTHTCLRLLRESARYVAADGQIEARGVPLARHCVEGRETHFSVTFERNGNYLVVAEAEHHEHPEHRSQDESSAVVAAVVAASDPLSLQVFRHNLTSPILFPGRALKESAVLEKAGEWLGDARLHLAIRTQQQLNAPPPSSLLVRVRGDAGGELEKTENEQAADAAEGSEIRARESTHDDTAACGSSRLLVIQYGDGTLQGFASVFQHVAAALALAVLTNRTLVEDAGCPAQYSWRSAAGAECRHGEAGHEERWACFFAPLSSCVFDHRVGRAVPRTERATWDPPSVDDPALGRAACDATRHLPVLNRSNLDTRVVRTGYYRPRDLVYEALSTPMFDEEDEGEGDVDEYEYGRGEAASRSSEDIPRGGGGGGEGGGDLGPGLAHRRRLDEHRLWFPRIQNWLWAPQPSISSLLRRHIASRDTSIGTEKVYAHAAAAAVAAVAVAAANNVTVDIVESPWRGGGQGEEHGGGGGSKVNSINQNSQPGYYADQPHPQQYSVLRGAIGIHVRRGDTARYKERTFAELDEYVAFARQIKRKTGARRVFLCSDDASVIEAGAAALAANGEFDVYTSVASHDSPKTPVSVADNVGECAQGHIASNPHLAYKMTAGVVADIAHLAECAYLIGTCMSQVSRLASELMHARGGLKSRPIALDYDGCNSLTTHYYPIEVPWARAYVEERHTGGGTGGKG
jgi:hypothetical protein